jgi:hypothetical protein
VISSLTAKIISRQFLILKSAGGDNMKNDSSKFNKIFLSKIAIFVFIGAFGISVFAQSTRTMTPVDRRIEQINRQIQRSERDNMTREMKGKNRKTVDSKQSQAIKTQIKKDFEALQTAYNKIVINLQSTSFERDFVLEAAAEVKKYASRLKDNLALPEPEKDAANEIAAKEELNLEDRRKSLRTLCQHIYNFVTNPIFNEPTGFDVEKAANAGREMDKIIEISEKIKETAEKSLN